MSKGALAWLRRELPKLVAAGVLTPDAAEAVRRHYGPAMEGRGDDEASLGRRLAAVLLAVLGTLLVGGGIVLLLAHNWDDLSRGTRAGLLVAFLLATQALAAYALARRSASAAWRESGGTLMVAAVAAAVSLVAQTYHVPGDLHGFYRTVLLLTLPAVYLLDSAAVSVLTWGALVGLASTGSAGRGEEALAWWGLAAAGAPFLVRLARREGESWRTALTIVVGVLALLIGGMVHAAQARWDGLWALYGLGLLAIAHALGSGDAQEPWRRRLRVPAFVGLVALGVLLTYAWPWRDVAGGLPLDADAGVWATAAVALALGAAATWFAVHLLRLGEIHLGLASAAWVVGALGYVLALAEQETWARLVFDLWLAAVGTSGLAEGWRSGRIVRANAGLLALAALAVARFFDADVSFVVRGLGFIGVGIGFLAVNVLLARRARLQAAGAR